MVNAVEDGFASIFDPSSYKSGPSVISTMNCELTPMHDCLSCDGFLVQGSRMQNIGKLNE